MGRRAAGHRFLPHHFVFPGGRVDAADFRAVPLAPLRPEVRARLETCCAPRLAEALAVAAVRETWEETGLALGEHGAAGLRPALDRLECVLRAITPSASPIRFHARFFLADAAHCSGALAGNGELLELAWRPVEDCLALPIADVTEYLLRALASGALGRAGMPLFAFRRGRSYVRPGGGD